MTKLSDTQAIILSAAARRGDRIALPLPSNLKGAAAKVVAAMIAKGFIDEVEARRIALHPHLSDPIWRETGDGHGTTLIATDAGLAAIGIGPESPDSAPASATARTPRESTKQAMLIAMLKRPEGATIQQVVDATGWLPHSVRGAIAGALKKKLGLNVVSEKVENLGRAYRINA